MVSPKLVVSLAALAASFAATTPPACVGSLPVGSFRLLVQPEKGGGVRSLRLLNNLKAGAKLRYEPVKIPDAVKQKAQVALVLLPSSQDLMVLDPMAAGKPAEWKVPADTAVVALVFGPRGLNVRKVKSLVGRNEEMLAQLADYAEQTEKIETLVDAVAKSEASGANIDAALAGFSAQYGVALPKIDTRAPSDQQAGVLLQDPDAFRRRLRSAESALHRAAIHRPRRVDRRHVLRDSRRTGGRWGVALPEPARGDVSGDRVPLGHRPRRGD